ncbi:right-handed parallel beta-helix repeat-containing protein [Clavibacter capsici]|uniref:right-handed parallel beta-helix repeat-containing protein n=1 Tax=Clavibacter capsici TaxID=1874630 RepID=UPI000AECBBE4|nr:right-handed parallel beta-helix repeat-containing protein [Clavibacter capsici]
MPSNALFVATTGSDAASGSASAPFRTIQRAVDVAASGRTIVVRGGTYHESVVMPKGEALALQSYPGEKVWLDGSRKLTQWVASGSAWYAPGWDLSFDTSPTYTRGAPDGTAASWSFVNPAFPLAAHPDQVWFGGTAQRQVATRAQVVPGTFFVDRAADRLYVGSDPRSSSVRSSDLISALQVRGDGSTVRGIGIRRYAPSVPDQGAVQIHGTRVAFEDVAITDIATIGLSVMATDARLTGVTAARNGMLGMRAVYADRLVATRLLVADNNLERFNRAPVSGGFKIGRSRDIRVLDSDFQRNAGNGLWFDESVHGITLTGNDVLDNTGAGIVLELSASATVADNVIARSGEEGLWIENSGHIGVWNNTFTANDRDIDISQGDRIATNLATAGHDPRQKLPDPTVTWVVTDITISNNVLQGSTGNALLAVEDHTHKRSAAQMGVRASGNVYQRDRADSPGWAVVWSRGPGNPAVYGTLAAFRDATGNDRTSVEVIGRRVLGSDLRITGEIASLQSRVAVGVPALIGSLTGIVTGSRVVGATAG